MTTDFEQIQFYPKFHQYIYNGKKLRSATNFCAQFAEPFKREEKAINTAKREGITVEEVLEKWDAKGKASREKGRDTHNHIERVLLGQTDLSDKFTAMSGYPPEIEAFNSLWLNGLSNQVQVLQAEWVIGDEDLGIGGTVDALFMDTDDQSIYIFDWKTGDMTTSSDYGIKLLPPFESYDDCKFHKYSLQVSLYRLIIERNTDIEIDSCKLVHLAPSGRYYIHQAVDFRALLETTLEPTS